MLSVLPNLPWLALTRSRYSKGYKLVESLSFLGWFGLLRDMCLEQETAANTVTGLLH